jgi:hypothetical protein
VHKKSEPFGSLHPCLVWFSIGPLHEVLIGPIDALKIVDVPRLVHLLVPASAGKIVGSSDPSICFLLCEGRTVAESCGLFVTPAHVNTS